MHIPDGFLAAPVWLGLDCVALPAVGVLARRAQREMEEARAPMLGVMGAFVFAAQMVNFPVGIGTSGHLVGGALLAITLGPAAACVVMTAILAIQGFVFQDGGILAMGANVFNMAIAGVLAGWVPYKLWGAGSWRRPAVFVAASVSVLVSALLALAELLVSGIRMPLPVLAVSLGLFLVSAAIEGTITLAVVEGIERLNSRLVRKASPAGVPALASIGIAAVLLAGGGILFASAAPDGLESLAGRIGIARLATSFVNSPLADYSARWMGASWTARSAAGLAGLGLIGALCAALGWMAARKRSA
jgi:cobalt/nickel transport system permease protein